MTHLRSVYIYGGSGLHIIKVRHNSMISSSLACYRYRFHRRDHLSRWRNEFFCLVIRPWWLNPAGTGFKSGRPAWRWRLGWSAEWLDEAEMWKRWMRLCKGEWCNCQADSDAKNRLAAEHQESRWVIAGVPYWTYTFIPACMIWEP